MIAAHAAPAFVALALKPCSDALPEPEEIRIRVAAVPGVEGVRPDLERLRLHVLYDGRASTLKHIMAAVRILGLKVHVPGYIWHSTSGR